MTLSAIQVFLMIYSFQNISARKKIHMLQRKE